MRQRYQWHKTHIALISVGGILLATGLSINNAKVHTVGTCLIVTGAISLVIGAIFALKSAEIPHESEADVSSADKKKGNPPRRGPPSASAVQRSLSPRKREIVQLSSGKKVALIRQAPEELMSIFDSHTDAEGQKLVSSYKGGWCAVEGTVGEVHDKNTYVHVILHYGENYKYVSAIFNKASQRQEALRLPKESSVEIIGQISGVNGSTLFLGKCELL